MLEARPVTVLLRCRRPEQGYGTGSEAGDTASVLPATWRSKATTTDLRHEDCAGGDEGLVARWRRSARPRARVPPLRRREQRRTAAAQARHREALLEPGVKIASDRLRWRFLRSPVFTAALPVLCYGLLARMPNFSRARAPAQWDSPPARAPSSFRRRFSRFHVRLNAAS